jgi:hypothetical protein
MQLIVSRAKVSVLERLLCLLANALARESLQLRGNEASGLKGAGYLLFATTTLHHMWLHNAKLCSQEANLLGPLQVVPGSDTSFSSC